jgi:hypothetical protein
MDEPFPYQAIDDVIATMQKLAGLGDGECFVGIRRRDPLRYRAEPKRAATAVFKPNGTVGSQSGRRRARDNLMSVIFHLQSTPRKCGLILLGGKCLSLVLAISSSLMFKLFECASVAAIRKRVLHGGKQPTVQRFDGRCLSHFFLGLLFRRLKHVAVYERAGQSGFREFT